MLTVTVDASGPRRALAAVRARLRDLTPAWRQVGADLIDTAVELTPVLSGALVRSLLARYAPWEVRVASELVYAGVQNYGWPARNIEASHFLDGRVLAANEDGAAREVVSVIEATARRVGLR